MAAHRLEVRLPASWFDDKEAAFWVMQMVGEWTRLELSVAASVVDSESVSMAKGARGAPLPDAILVFASSRSLM